MAVAIGRRTRSSLAVYGSALRRAGAGARVAVTAVDPTGRALSDPFPWAYVSTDHLRLLARAVGLRILDRWAEAGRWFAGLS